MSDDEGAPPEHVADLVSRRRAVQVEMGGPSRIGEQHARGRLTVRERIDRLCDDGTFSEIGTFVRAQRVEHREMSPGDGKIGGHALVDGRPITVVGDDVTVFRGSGAENGARKVGRLYDQARRQGNPFVYLADGGGARLPDILGAEGLVSVTPKNFSSREIPRVCLVLGDSYGGPSFVSAFSDFVVQLRGTAMAVVSPRVVEVAVGEQVDGEALGGADVHEQHTGQIDLAVDTEDEAFDAARRFLSYLPSNASQRCPPTEPREPEGNDDIRAIVPLERRRGYDMKRVIRCIVDAGELLELRPRFARSVFTGLARIGGESVGIVASQPMFEAGTLSPDACDKATRFLCLCDSFSVPVVFLQDTPGFVVGTAAERGRLLYKGIMMLQALMAFTGLKVTVVIRKAYGLAFTNLGGSNTGSDRLYAWPTAELSQMDTEVGANVLYGKQLDALEGAARAQKLASLTSELTRGTDPYAAAAVFGIDDVIDPAETRERVIEALRLHGGAVRPSPLSSWPTCW